MYSSGFFGGFEGLKFLAWLPRKFYQLLLIALNMKQLYFIELLGILDKITDPIIDWNSIFFCH
jgi:hypothetical protein